MGWKELPSWLRGGIWGLIITILLVLLSTFVPVIGMSSRFGIIGLILFLLCGDKCQNPVLYFVLLWATLPIIGIIIGLIVGKIKSRKESAP